MIIFALSVFIITLVVSLLSGILGNSQVLTDGVTTAFYQLGVYAGHINTVFPMDTLLTLMTWTFQILISYFIFSLAMYFISLIKSD